MADDADVDVAIADILSQVEQGTGDEWFNRVRYAELDGRNLTEAWLAGDHEGVYQVLALGYERTEAGADRLRSQPEVMALLQRRRAEIADSGHAKRSA